MKVKTTKRSPTKTPRKRKPDNPEQFKRFVEAARKAEVDESGEAFERALDKIVPPARRHQTPQKT
jgi:hypothetical protein